ncbi:GNAT family N-acetyltransferase [Candidatus Gottesmanbacteria bacterium]|nr:GNAT family N-acetyltransferase [Candidatus Gottesmanbacteria bacterium]
MILYNSFHIGAIVILDKYQGKGYGKRLLAKVANDFSNQNLYIGSSNEIVGNIVTKLGFRKVSNFSKLPGEIKIYLVKYFLERLDVSFLLDALRKSLYLKRGKYLYFVKMKIHYT